MIGTAKETAGHEWNEVGENHHIVFSFLQFCSGVLLQCAAYRSGWVGREERFSRKTIQKEWDKCTEALKGCSHALFSPSYRSFQLCNGLPEGEAWAQRNVRSFFLPHRLCIFHSPGKNLSCGVASVISLLSWKVFWKCWFSKQQGWEQGLMLWHSFISWIFTLLIRLAS